MPVCDRTPQVRDAILAALSLTDCAAVTSGQLQAIETLDLSGLGLTFLQSGDFSGLSGLTDLNLARNELTALPEDVFAGLYSLRDLNLYDNALTFFPAGLFDGLIQLESLGIGNDRSYGSGITGPPTNVFDADSFPHGLFAGLESLDFLSAWNTDIIFPLILEETTSSDGSINLRVVFPHGAPGVINVELVARDAALSQTQVILRPGETHSVVVEVTPTAPSWLVSAFWNEESRSGYEIEAAILGSGEGARRSFADRPDDISGPQIHVVYAVLKDDKDRELDRHGLIATSFENIQDWLASEIGRTLRLDTYQGELDVTFLELDELPGLVQGEFGEALGPGSLEGIASLLPRRTADKKYAVYFDVPAPVAGLGDEGIGVGATYLAGRTPGVAGIGEAERTMLHEVIHMLGGVGDCAPNSLARFEGLQGRCGATGHVTDDPHDLMGVQVVEIDGEITRVRYFGGTTLDANRDDYIGHGRPGCFDLLRSPYVE